MTAASAPRCRGRPLPGLQRHHPGRPGGGRGDDPVPGPGVRQPSTPPAPTGRQTTPASRWPAARSPSSSRLPPRPWCSPAAAPRRTPWPSVAPILAVRSGGRLPRHHPGHRAPRRPRRVPRARTTAPCRRDLPRCRPHRPGGPARGVAAAMIFDTVLVSVMHANNETGAIQPIARIAQTTGSAGVLLHVDAAQSAGKIDVDVDALEVDLPAHRGRAQAVRPQGIGALYVRPRVALHPLIGGGGQEHGRAGRHRERGVRRRVRRSRRPGPLALLAEGETQRLQTMRDRLEHRLAKPAPRPGAPQRADAPPAQHRQRPDGRRPGTGPTRRPDRRGRLCGVGLPRRTGRTSGVLTAMGTHLDHGSPDRDPRLARPLDHTRADRRRVCPSRSHTQPDCVRYNAGSLHSGTLPSRHPRRRAPISRATVTSNPQYPERTDPIEKGSRTNEHITGTVHPPSTAPR